MQTYISAALTLSLLSYNVQSKPATYLIETEDGDEPADPGTPINPFEGPIQDNGWSGYAAENREPMVSPMPPMAPGMGVSKVGNPIDAGQVQDVGANAGMQGQPGAYGLPDGQDVGQPGVMPDGQEGGQNGDMPVGNNEGPAEVMQEMPEGEEGAAKGPTYDEKNEAGGNRGRGFNAEEVEEEEEEEETEVEEEQEEEEEEKEGGDEEEGKEEGADEEEGPLNRGIQDDSDTYTDEEANGDDYSLNYYENNYYTK